MGQPVRRNIKEAHPDIGIKPFYTLIIDGTNLLRISFADTKLNSKGQIYGPAFQFLLQMKIMMQKRQFDYVYVFFDDEYSGVLRYQLYKEYKANRDKHYESYSSEPLSDYMKEFNARVNSMYDYFKSKNKVTKDRVKTDAEKVVDENFARIRSMLCNYFNETYIRWMMDEITEGDDLIAYYVQHKKPEEKIVIMSGDEDITQLISDSVCVYNPRVKRIFSSVNFKQEKGFPVENVVLKKIFLGDTSDNIGNIKGVSESRLMELMPEISQRPVSVNEIKDRAKMLCEERVNNKKKPLAWQENIVNGISNKEYDGDFYEINEKIISLKEPLLSESAKEEIDSMMYNSQDPEGRSFGNLYNLFKEDGIEELLDENKFSNFFIPFKELANREIKRFNENK